MLGLWLLALTFALVLCFPTVDAVSLKQHVHSDGGASFVNAPLVRSMTAPSRPPLPNTHRGTGPPPLAAFRSGMPSSAPVLCRVFKPDGENVGSLVPVPVTASTTLEQLEDRAQQLYIGKGKVGNDTYLELDVRTTNKYLAGRKTIPSPLSLVKDVFNQGEGTTENPIRFIIKPKPGSRDSVREEVRQLRALLRLNPFFTPIVPP